MSATAERRNNARSKFACFARCRQLDARIDGPERLCVVKDYSHDGIHFLVFKNDEILRQQTRLLLRFPHGDHSPLDNREYLVEIMRINSVLRGRYGVGARLVRRIPVRLRGGLFVPRSGLSGYEPPDAYLKHIDLYA